MSVEALPHEHEGQPQRQEKKEVTEGFLNFDDYRQFCDVETDAFRHVGVLERDSYNDALGDPRTVYCEMGETKIPVLIPIDYEDMYNAERIRALTGKQDVMLLAAPLASIWEGALQIDELRGGNDLSDSVAIVVEEPNDPNEARQVDPTLVAEMFNIFGNMQPHEFIDQRLEHLEKNREAWMGIFNFSIHSKREIDENMSNMDVRLALVEAWRQYAAEKDISLLPEAQAEGTYFFESQQLRQHPEIIGDLWEIAKVGFGDVLGKYHPISMEVTKNFFDQHILSEGAFTAVRYRDGKPMSFGFIAPEPEPEQNDWLDCDSTVMKEDLQAAAERGETVAHFYELISRGEKELALSSSITGLFLELASRVRKDWHIIFESTNLSETYIPRMAELQVKRSENIELSRPVEMLSKFDYWYLATENS